MIVGIQHVVARSGDASITAVSSLDQVVTIELELDEFESVRVALRTGSFYSALDPRGQPFNTGRLEIFDVDGAIATEHGYLVPPTSFADVMNQTREFFQLAWGKKADECRHLLYFRGSRILFAAPIRDLADVSCEVTV